MPINITDYLLRKEKAPPGGGWSACGDFEGQSLGSGGRGQSQHAVGASVQLGGLGCLLLATSVQQRVNASL